MVHSTGPVLLLLGLSGAMGQVFIFVTISKFGALTCSIIGAFFVKQNLVCMHLMCVCAVVSKNIPFTVCGVLYPNNFRSLKALQQCDSSAALLRLRVASGGNERD